MAVISYKCPNCDGELVFDPGTQKYKCEYCASLFTEQELAAMKPAASAEQPGFADEMGVSDATGTGTGTAGTSDAARLYTCPSCGAEIVTDETTAATFCYYCHNPVVLGGKLEGKWLPDKVIPFEVTKEKAVAGFLDYVGKKKFVPRAFFNKRQIESITGVYFPYWMYDVELSGRVQGDAERIRRWRTGDTEHKEIKYYAVEREGDVSLYHLSSNALKKANAVLAKGVLPYRFEKMKDFGMGYLSGFLAERRDIEKREVEGAMQATMRESAEKLFRETIRGYDLVHIQNSGFTARAEYWNYVLFPVWTITYKARNGKVYYYSMNGQTGKVCGELPLNYGKVTLVSAIVALIVLALGLMGGYFI